MKTKQVESDIIGRNSITGNPSGVWRQPQPLSPLKLRD